MPPYTTERDWIAALQANDPAAYEALVEAFAEPIYRLAYRIVHSPEDAEDVLQETFLKAYLHIHKFQGRSGLKTWLYRIATHEALAVLRRRKRKIDAATVPIEMDSNPEEERPLAAEQMADTHATSPEDWALAHETEACVMRAVERLSPPLRAALVLHLFEGLPLPEVAEALGISHGAAKVRVHRARQRLRQTLTPCLEETPSAAASTQSQAPAFGAATPRAQRKG